MKQIKIIILIGLIFGISNCFAQLEIPGAPTIYNQDESQYINSDNINNPIRDGAYNAIQSPDSKNSIGGVQGIGNKIEDHTTAKTKTLKIINNAINFVLGLLSLFGLIYLIYNGFIMITAAGDDSKYKEGLKGIKYAIIAIGGVGLSWVIVSSIFRLVNRLALSSNGVTPIETSTYTNSAKQY